MTKKPTDVMNDTQVADYVQDVLIRPGTYSGDPVKIAASAHLGQIYAFVIFDDGCQVRDVKPFVLSTAKDIYLKKPNASTLWHNATTCTAGSQLPTSKFYCGDGQMPSAKPSSQWTDAPIYGCNENGTTTPDAVLNSQVIIYCTIVDTAGANRDISFRIARS